MPHSVFVLHRQIYSNKTDLVLVSMIWQPGEGAVYKKKRYNVYFWYSGNILKN